MGSATQHGRAPAAGAAAERLPAGVGAAAPPGAGASAEDLARLLGAFNDVTSRLSATHEALRGEVAALKAELSEANRQVERSKHLAALGEMAAGIAHEIRNPLGSIMLYARMLQEDLAALPEQQTTARKIASGVERLNAVVGDVLAFSREMRVRPAAMDAGELLRGALEAARGGGAEWDGVAVEIRGGGVEVRADPTLMQQALINLVRNGVEAMHEHRSQDRRLRLAATRRSVRREDGATRPMVSLAVRDTGPGIPADVRTRLFNPFFTTRAAGTGLGLAIVHRIVDAHGGRTAVRDAAPPLGGAVVELLLPCGGEDGRNAEDWRGREEEGAGC